MNNEEYMIDSRAVIGVLYHKGFTAKEISPIVGMTAGRVAALQAHNTMKIAKGKGKKKK